MKIEDQIISARFGKYGKITKQKAEGNHVVMYTRVSGKGQFDKNDSLETQRLAIEEYAKKNNLIIVECFGQTYESAKTDDRKEFKRMLDFIKKSKVKISTILVYKIVRFSRTGGKAISIADDLRENYGIHLTAVTEPIDTSNASGVLFQDMQLLFGRWDNEQRKQVSTAGMKAKFEKGIWVTKPPQGYDIVRSNGERKIVVNEVGKQIKKAWNWKIQGMKNEEIILKLNALGVKMYKQQLHKIFCNPFYCGLIAHGMLNGKVVVGLHEKMISKEQFLKVNNIISSSTKYGVPHKMENINLPLKVFMCCSSCNQPFTGYIVKKKGIYYYKCRTTGCKCNKSAKSLHELFLYELNQYQVNEDLMEAICIEIEGSYHDLNKGRVETKNDLMIRMAEIKRNKSKLEEKYFINEAMSKEIYERLCAKFNDEQQLIEKEMEQTSISISNLKEMIQETILICRNLSKIWVEGSISIKEKLQNLVFPSGLIFDKEKGSFRTPNVNIIFAAIACKMGSSTKIKKGLNFFLQDKSLSAEKEGFEPSVQFPVRMFSKHVLSATQAPLQL